MKAVGPAPQGSRRRNHPFDRRTHPSSPARCHDRSRRRYERRAQRLPDQTARMAGFAYPGTMIDEPGHSGWIAGRSRHPENRLHHHRYSGKGPGCPIRAAAPPAGTARHQPAPPHGQSCVRRRPDAASRPGTRSDLISVNRPDPAATGGRQAETTSAILPPQETRSTRARSAHNRSWTAGTSRTPPDRRQRPPTSISAVQGPLSHLVAGRGFEPL